MILKFHLQTGSRLCVAKEKDNLASGLTINGEYVLNGKREKSTTLRSLIIIRRFKK